MTGFNLPPGVTTAMIDAAYGEEGPCGICGQDIERCICPKCPVCESYGDPMCYALHGLTRSLGQVVMLARAEARWALEAEANAKAEAAMLDEWERSHDNG